MNCSVCKTKEATNHNKDFHICDSCLIELQLSTRFYIGGVEVTPEEYYRRIQDGK